MCTNDRRRRRRSSLECLSSDFFQVAEKLRRRPARPRGFTTYLELPNITSQDILASSMLPEKEFIDTSETSQFRVFISECSARMRLTEKRTRCFLQFGIFQNPNLTGILNPLGRKFYDADFATGSTDSFDSETKNTVPLVTGKQSIKR